MAKAAAGAGVFSIVPGCVLGRNGRKPPSETLNIALAGVAGRGRRHVDILNTEKIVAMCDVDWSARTAESFEKAPNAKKYRDYRVMLDKQHKDIDAVVVCTPDHTHAVISMAAMELGKHVYCEKPLAHSIGEVRALMKAARRYGVKTQMGNQGHSSEHIRILHEWIDDGAIGHVREVHAWSDRLSGRFKLGTGRPSETPPVPSTLDWDLWLGPAAYRPYHNCYLPGKWRGWVDFGTGAIGDMGCHILDPAFWTLGLGSPESVQARTTYVPGRDSKETYPKMSTIVYEFPARDEKPPVTLKWFDGGRMPPRPDELEPDREMRNNGAFLYGDKGTIMHGSHGAKGLCIIPQSKMTEYKSRLPEKTLPRVPGHQQDWFNACKGGNPSSANFDYGGPLTEMVLLGALASRFKDRMLVWDSKTMTITNDTEANELVNPPYREEFP